MTTDDTARIGTAGSEGFARLVLALREQPWRLDPLRTEDALLRCAGEAIEACYDAETEEAEDVQRAIFALSLLYYFAARRPTGDVPIEPAKGSGSV